MTIVQRNWPVGWELNREQENVVRSLMGSLSRWKLMCWIATRPVGEEFKHRTMIDDAGYVPSNVWNTNINTLEKVGMVTETRHGGYGERFYVRTTSTAWMLVPALLEHLEFVFELPDDFVPVGEADMQNARAKLLEVERQLDDDSA